MSDLAQQLRDSTHWYHSDCELKMECAARIENLEEQNKEMLEALEEIVKEYCENPDNGRTLRWAIEGAKEAIAKAKGEE